MSEGRKNDNGKPPITLIPREAIEGAARAFDFGARKYDRHNFRNGIDMSRLLDASMRHILAYANGEDLDPESGLSHLDHGIASLCMAKFMEANRPERDDRWKEKKVEVTEDFHSGLRTRNEKT